MVDSRGEIALPSFLETFFLPSVVLIPRDCLSSSLNFFSLFFPIFFLLMRRVFLPIVSERPAMSPLSDFDHDDSPCVRNDCRPFSITRFYWSPGTTPFPTARFWPFHQQEASPLLTKTNLVSFGAAPVFFCPFFLTLPFCAVLWSNGCVLNRDHRRAG